MEEKSSLKMSAWAAGIMKGGFPYFLNFVFSPFTVFYVHTVFYIIASEAI